MSIDRSHRPPSRARGPAVTGHAAAIPQASAATAPAGTDDMPRTCGTRR